MELEEPSSFLVHHSPVGGAGLQGFSRLGGQVSWGPSQGTEGSLELDSLEWEEEARMVEGDNL